MTVTQAFEKRRFHFTLSMRLYLFYAPDLKSKHLIEVAARSLPPRSNDDGTDLILFQMTRAG